MVIIQFFILRFFVSGGQNCWNVCKYILINCGPLILELWGHPQRDPIISYQRCENKSEIIDPSVIFIAKNESPVPNPLFELFKFLLSLSAWLYMCVSVYVCLCESVSVHLWVRVYPIYRLSISPSQYHYDASNWLLISWHLPDFQSIYLMRFCFEDHLSYVSRKYGHVVLSVA